MAEREAAGWRYGPVRDDAAQKHPSMLDWPELPETARHFDREAVRAIPKLLGDLGLYAVRRRRRIIHTSDHWISRSWHVRRMKWQPESGRCRALSTATSQHRAAAVSGQGRDHRAGPAQGHVAAYRSAAAEGPQGCMRDHDGSGIRQSG
jgi:hypothetical protein